VACGHGWRRDPHDRRTSAAVGVALLLAVVVLLFILLQLASVILMGPARLSAFLVRRRAGKAYNALSRGLVAAAAGDAQQANQAARHAEKLLGKNPLSLLLSAQAAELANDEEHQQAACSAMLTHPETEFLGARGLAALALRRGNSEQALAFALRAHALKPNAENAATALFDLRIRRGERIEAQMLFDKELQTKRLSTDNERRWREALRSLEPGASEFGAPNGGSAPA
jgi:HemY protein